MKVTNWMTKDPITTTPSAGLMSVLAEMSRKKIRRMPVMGDGRVVGIITKSDIYAALGPLDNLSARLSQGKVNVGAYMTPDPVTLGPEASLEEAAAVMYRRRVSGVPVLEDEKLVGIITETDMFRAFVELLGFTDAGAMVEFDLEKPDHLLSQIRKKTANMIVRNLIAFHHHHTGKMQVRMKLRGREITPTKRAEIPKKS